MGLYYGIFNYRHLVFNQFSKIKWWKWFRDGSYIQLPKKKKKRKESAKVLRQYWLKCLPHKSGYTGPAMKRRKGK